LEGTLKGGLFRVERKGHRCKSLAAKGSNYKNCGMEPSRKGPEDGRRIFDQKSTWLKKTLRRTIWEHKSNCERDGEGVCKRGGGSVQTGRQLCGGSSKIKKHREEEKEKEGIAARKKGAEQIANNPLKEGAKILQRRSSRCGNWSEEHGNWKNYNTSNRPSGKNRMDKRHKVAKRAR